MRRYLLIVICPVLLVVAVATALTIFFGPITGDLVRIGRWTEWDFGGKAVQPVLAINANGSAITNPDILVLGDSFSRGNFWQSIVSTRLNQKTLSFHYGQVGCLDNWLQFALNDPSAKTVIVEVVERSFIGIFFEQGPCQKARPQPFELASGTTHVQSVLWPPVVNLGYAYMAGGNTLKMAFNAAAPVRGKMVVNTPLNKDCGNFSNRRSDRMLYLLDDEDKLKWTDASVNTAIARILEIQNTFETHGKKFILMVVPDKLTVYQGCLLDDRLASAKFVNVTDQLIAAGVNTPDILRAFNEAVVTRVDLYKPDDTHLSESGFTFLAQEVERFMLEGSVGHPLR